MYLRFLIPACCLLLMGATPEPDKKNLDDVRRKIEETSARAIEFEREATGVSQEISVLRRQLIRAAEEIQQTESRISETEASLRALDQQEAELEEQLAGRTKQMSATLGAMQRLSQKPPELVAFRPGEAVNTLRSAGLLRHILPELQQRAEMIREDMTELQKIRADIRTERRELNVALSQLVNSQTSMDQLVDERRRKYNELEASTRRERAQLRVFAAKAKTLQELIQKIEQRARVRAQAAREAARLANQPLRRPPPIAAIPKGTGSFASAKGALPLPARGQIKQVYGQLSAQGETSKGITIEARRGATVITPHDGRIVFAGKFRTYGRLLIIAHGDGYHTLLAGLDRIDGVVGQWILKGEPVGQMSALILNDSTIAQRLYVELRHMGKPINPLPWIAARDRKVHG